LCAAVARGWEAVLPERLIGAGDLMEAIQSFDAESSETGDSRKTLRRYGMVRATLQPEFGALAPGRAVAVVSSETGAPAAPEPLQQAGNNDVLLGLWHA